MKSQRKDRLGHWPAGKPRSPLTDIQVSRVLSKLQRALQEQSMIQVAKTLGIADTTVGKILRGDDRPSQRTYDLVMARL